MRLTLRTLLAYLDDSPKVPLLEPDDTEGIGRKIEESEFATNLVHRIRECMRRLRLGVPPVLGRGLGGDPNTVAEYLENTLSSERVGEFEKICLESDVHLAEVASCHQVLTFVMAEPAEIDPRSRERMYGLIAHADAPPVEEEPVAVLSGGGPATSWSETSASGSRRPKPEVPEYLRETRSRFWPVAAMVALAAMLTFGALMVLDPAGLRERVLALVQPAEDDLEVAAVDSGDEPSAASVGGAPSASADDNNTDAAPTPPTELAAPDVTAPEDSAAPVAPEPGDAPPRDATPGPDAAPEDAPAADVAPPEPADTEAAPAQPAGDKPLEDAAPGDAGDKPAARSGDADAAPVAAESMGRYLSKRDVKDVLLRLDAQSGDWVRLAPMAQLYQGDRLMSLPVFRPSIILSSNITIQADGPMLVELAGKTDQGVPILRVEYGRLLMATVGKAGNSLQLEIDERPTQLTFVDADATLALEARRMIQPGKDPEAGQSPSVVDLYASSGLIRVRDAEKAFEMHAPEHRQLAGGAGQAPADLEFPKWVGGEALSDSERQATSNLEPELPADKPVVLRLKELADDQQRTVGRRREVRALAIRSLASLGDFGPSLKPLLDKEEKNVWASYIEALRTAVARSPETAAQVRATLEQQRGGDAARLYRMLWGYTADDLKNGAAGDLVGYLDHDSLDFRVLAIWNLQNVTGLANFGYRPGDMAAQRRAAIRSWTGKLREGKIVPRSAATGSKPKASAKAAEKSAS